MRSLSDVFRAFVYHGASAIGTRYNIFSKTPAQHSYCVCIMFFINQPDYGRMSFAVALYLSLIPSFSFHRRGSDL